jgi:Ca-activated chloride channel family protein
VKNRFGIARFSLLIAIVVLCLFPAGSGGAQQSASPQTLPLRSATELVKLDVSVLDQSGKFVAGLTADDFRVLDNGIEQPVAFFSPVQTPAQILVMLETSPAVYLIQNEHIVASYALLNGLAPDDQVALATYDSAPHGILGFTEDKSALVAALSQVQYTIGTGDLNLYDSISTVLDWLGSSTGKKALVLLSTGLDSSAPSNWEALARKLRKENLVIFPIALGGSLRGEPESKSKKKTPRKAGKQEPESSPADGSKIFAKGDAALLSLASITGGRAYFPKSANDFVQIYRQIADELRNEYVLGIQPAHDGGFHSLTVQVIGNADESPIPNAKTPAYRIFARAGYLAPKL